MKKLVLILAVMMMAAPAMADIVITIDNGVYPAEVKYENTGGTQLARAFALDIKTDLTADINGMTDLSAKYWVHPGSIIILAGDVNDEGNAWADPSYEGTEGGIDTNGVTIEMASLYVGSGNAPPTSGTLCSFTVTGQCLVSITENTIRSGVVLEDTNSATSVLDLSGATNIQVGPVTECYAGPDLTEWRNMGSPPSWCFPRQCHGDADGLQEGFMIKYYVGFDDLSIFVDAWQEMSPTLAQLAADFDHAEEGFMIKFRVAFNDLGILVANWQQNPTPDCNP